MENNNKAGFSNLFEYLLTRHRGWFAVIALLPISVVFDLYAKTRNWLLFRLSGGSARHERKVQRAMQQIEEWKKDGYREKLCTARSGWLTTSELVPKYKLSHRPIDVRMYDILEIDENRRTVRVEPLVTMGQLSRALVSRGWTLPVVPELDELTIGGLIMGFGVETSSHKYGLFQHICISYDILTAEGKRVTCSASENPELFYLIPWSYGTLGFLVAAELRIIPAKKYIKIHYQPVSGLASIAELFEKESRDAVSNDFVEGILYSRDTAVIMRGTFADEIGHDGVLNRIGRWHKPWFYKHAETYLKDHREGIEYIPTIDYFHRHTRSYFWTMEEIIPFGNHPVCRWLLGWALPPRLELLKYTETQTTKKLREKHHVIQDMLMPIGRLEASVRYFDEHFRLYPLWLAPMAICENPLRSGFIGPLKTGDGSVDELYVDIGAYGTPAKEGFDNNIALPALEQFVIENHGYQALYAVTTLSRDQFRAMFDHRDYDRLRERLPYCTQAFDEVYDKISSKGRVSPAEMRKLQKRAKLFNDPGLGV